MQSDYILVPSRETHRETLTCVTMYNEEVFTDSVTLDIQCKRRGGRGLEGRNGLFASGGRGQTVFMCLRQMSQMCPSMGLMEIGTSTEKTSS